MVQEDGVGRRERFVLLRAFHTHANQMATTIL